MHILTLGEQKKRTITSTKNNRMKFEVGMAVQKIHKQG